MISLGFAGGGHLSGGRLESPPPPTTLLPRQHAPRRRHHIRRNQTVLQQQSLRRAGLRVVRQAHKLHGTRMAQSRRLGYFDAQSAPDHILSPPYDPPPFTASPPAPPSTH